VAAGEQVDLIHDPSGRWIASGELSALFLPRHGMLGASLRFRGLELLRRLENLETAAEKGSTAGIPLLYPWANRLESLAYSTAAKNVELPETSPLLHFDDHGLAIHGVPWALLVWELLQSSSNSLVARLDWHRPDLLAIFPFPHRVEMTATILPNSLRIETVVIALDDPVPVSFGFHPYFGLPKIPRSEWQLNMPTMRRLRVNANGIPSGIEEPFSASDAPFGDSVFDDGFALPGRSASFSIAGAGLKIVVEFLEGFNYAQIFAPKGKEFIAIEPMTAPTNALTSGRGLTVIQPRGKFRAAFRINIDSIR
jgi:aldose 1-epimerase